MRAIWLLFTIFILFCSDANAIRTAPLIYKYSKEIKAETPVEFTSFDATKFRQIRVAVKRKPEYKEEPDISFDVYIAATDGEDELPITSGKDVAYYLTVIDSPPPTLRVKLRGTGTFTLYVWASA